MRKILEIGPPAEGLPVTKVRLRKPILRLQNFWQKGKFYESETLGYIRRNYSGGVFVDCGSSIGNHTLFFSMYCKPYFVVSIEPVESSLAHQKANLALNGIKNVHCFNVALSDKPGVGRMVKSKLEPWNEGMWNLEVGKGKREIATLDSLLKDISDITLIKLDIEGFELQALEGAKRILETQHPVLFIEGFPKRHVAQFSKFLSQFGYGNAKEVFKSMYEFKVK